MLRTTCAAMMGCVAACLILAAPAPATPATPTISVQQTEALKVKLTASTGTQWTWTVQNAAGATVAAATGNPATVSVPAAGDYTAVVQATDADPVATAPAEGRAAFHAYAKPSASFTYVQLANGTIQFTDTSTGEPTAWTWTFPGVNKNFKGRVPPPQGLPVGTSTVTLKVTNPAGNSTVSEPVTVNGPPQAVLSVLSSPAAMNAAVLLDASRSTDPNHDALSFSWDLNGDGTFGDAAGALQTVRYPLPGSYRVAVQVSDGHGGLTTAEAAITVLADIAPSVTFTNDPTQPQTGATVGFTASASDPDGRITRIEWDLDDDGQFDDAAGPAASWQYDTVGSHRVAVRAVDDMGVATVAFRSIDVVAPVFATDLLKATSYGPSPQSSAPGPAIPNGPAPTASHALLLTPFPVVRIRGVTFHGAVQISLIQVQAPSGAMIRVRCRAGSCSARHADVRVRAARAPVLVRSLEQRRLRAGTVVEVFVTAPHRIGKYTRFKIRRDATPARTDLCLAPGRTRPTACPTS